MGLDYRARRDATNRSATTHAELVPGQRTLTEQLPVPRRPAPDTTSGIDTMPSAGKLDPGGRAEMLALFGVQRAAVAPAEPVDDPAKVHAAAAHGASTPATTLPHADRIQRLFGRHDISGIQAHVGPEAAATARAMGARAYATGDHVVLGEKAGLHTVAHEAAHVIQQRSGVQLERGVGEAGDAHERHADEVADRVVRGDSAEGLLDSRGTSVAPGDMRPVQRSGKGQHMPFTAGAEPVPDDHEDELPPLIGDSDAAAGGAEENATTEKEKEKAEEKAKETYKETDKEKGACEDAGDPAGRFSRASRQGRPTRSALDRFQRDRRGRGHRRSFLPPHPGLRQEPLCEPPEQARRKQRNAVEDLSAALDGLVWAVQGSYAAILHGAPITAGDIDVVLLDLAVAVERLKRQGFELRSTGTLICKMKHHRGTDIDLVSNTGGNFGINPADRVAIHGVYVMNLCEVVISLLLRPGRRDKDVVALDWLLQNKGDSLDELQRERIVQVAAACPHTPPVTRGCQTWEELLTRIREGVPEPTPRTKQ